MGHKNPKEKNPRPTRQEVNAYFQELIQREFGEEIKFYDADNFSLKEIIDKYKKEGWTCWGVARKINIKKPPKNKQVKIIGLGERFIIFVKDEREKN